MTEDTAVWVEFLRYVAYGFCATLFVIVVVAILDIVGVI